MVGLSRQVPLLHTDVKKLVMTHFVVIYIHIHIKVIPGSVTGVHVRVCTSITFM